MSRSRQADRLAAHLSEITGVRVELIYDTGATWHMGWTDGPLREEMRAHLAQALTDDSFAAMRDRTITTHRGTSCRAWAARATDSRREGTLAPAVAEHAAWARINLPQRVGAVDQLTPEDHALLRHIDQLIEATPYPERASAPEDEPLIEELLNAGTRTLGSGHRQASEFEMTRVLLAADRAPTGDQPPQLRGLGLGDQRNSD